MSRRTNATRAAGVRGSSTTAGCRVHGLAERDPVRRPHRSRSHGGRPVRHRLRQPLTHVQLPSVPGGVEDVEAHVCSEARQPHLRYHYDLSAGEVLFLVLIHEGWSFLPGRRTTAAGLTSVAGADAVLAEVAGKGAAQSLRDPDAPLSLPPDQLIIRARWEGSDGRLRRPWRRVSTGSSSTAPGRYPLRSRSP